MKNYITFNKLQYAEKFNEKINTETSLNHETKKDFNKEKIFETDFIHLP